MNHSVPIALLTAYLIVFGICAISPYDRAVWWVENVPIILIVLVVVSTYRLYQFTAISYVSMSFLVILHTIGGHYTFERVPFELVTETFGFARNHYDRVAHFTVGFYAYPVAELLLVKKLVNSKSILFLFPLFSILSLAGLYEMFEWQYALRAEPGSGLAVLESQGDDWDAQKDILADGLGALVSLIFFYLLNRVRISEVT